MQHKPVLLKENLTVGVVKAATFIGVQDTAAGPAQQCRRNFSVMQARFNLFSLSETSSKRKEIQVRDPGFPKVGQFCLLPPWHRTMEYGSRHIQCRLHRQWPAGLTGMMCCLWWFKRCVASDPSSATLPSILTPNILQFLNHIMCHANAGNFVDAELLHTN